MAAANRPCELTIPEPYFPPYDTVDDIPIFRSADESVWEHDSAYLADIPALIENHRNWLTITNLQNAMSQGKECAQLVISTEDHQRGVCLLNGIKTFRELYDRCFMDRIIPEGCAATVHKLKSNRVFSPFREIRPIAMPNKWTIPHVWKGMLTGQIYRGEINCITTDDYAYDAAAGYSKGVSLHMPSFAKKLIEEPSGWRVHPDSGEGKTAVLSVCCHSFDLRTVYFDESCNLEMAEQRRKERNEKREKRNSDMLSLHLDDVVLDPLKMYDISYLQMDDNTDQYEVAKALVSGNRIEEGNYYRGRHIIAAEIYPVVKDAFYQITDFFNRPGDVSDARMVQITDWDVFVTGHALETLIRAGDSFAISGTPKSAGEMEKELLDHASGRVQTLFGKWIDYRVVSERFYTELERAREAMQLSK
jgi:hypothetical protein